MARILTVYAGERAPFRPVDASLLRWLGISQALARRGHEVDLATAEPGWRGLLGVRMGPRLRRLPFRRVRLERYDVVKTEFHRGFETLEALETRLGARHPFVISKLGSVVGPEDRKGVYFEGRQREALFATQQRIARASRVVTVLSEPSRALWRECFGESPPTLLAPGAAEATLPPPGPDPFAGETRRRCVFAGNFYHPAYQPAAHACLVGKLNALGRALAPRGVRLYVVGPGDGSRLDREHLSWVGPVPYRRSWDWLRCADVGIALALGPEPNHNESTKLYHYLRAGLPTVCEAGFPNEGLVAEAGLGFVAPNGRMDAMADRIEAALRSDWDREAAVDLVLRRHTWDARAALYDAVLAEAASEASRA